MKRRGLLIFVFLILSIGLISASLNVSLSDQGTNVKLKSNGSLVEGDLGVAIYDTITGGNLIYSETFSGAIVNGSWNIMLGENSSNPLSLEYGKIYYKDYSINGEDLDFTDSYGNIMERRYFYSPLGDITDEDISSSANLTVSNLESSNNLSAINGFFSFLGDLSSRITSLFVQNINFTGNVSGVGNIETSGNVSADYFIGDGSQLTGLQNGNESFNQSLTDSLYYPISNPENFINETTGQIFNNTNLVNSVNTTINIQHLYNATLAQGLSSINTTENIQNLLNSTGIYDQGNKSFNQSLTDTLYTNQTYVDGKITIVNSSVSIVNFTLSDRVNILNSTKLENGTNVWFSTVGVGTDTLGNDYLLDVAGNARIQGNLTVTDSLTQLSIQNLIINGSILPEQDAMFDIGNSTMRWRNATFSGTINTGNILVNGKTVCLDDETNCNFSRLESVNNSLSNYNETDLISSVNTTINIQHLYNATLNQGLSSINTTENIQNLLDSTGIYDQGNESFNQSLTDSLYIPQSEEGNLNVNSSTWWQGVSGWISGWFIKDGINLAFNETKLNDTIQSLVSGGNSSFNQTLTDSLYAPNTTAGIQELYNSTAIQIAQEYAGNGSYTSTDLEYGYFTLSTNQVSNLAVGNHVQFDTRDAGNINISTGSGQANGLVTLHAGKTYVIEAGLSVTFSSSTNSQVDFMFRNSDNSTYYGNEVGVVPISSAHNSNQILLTKALIIPTEDIQIKLDIVTVSALVSTLNKGNCYLYIEEIGTAVSVSSSSSSSTGEYGYFTLSADQTTNIATSNHIEFDTRDAGNINISTGSGQANGLVTLHAGKKYRLESQMYVSFGGAGGNQLRARFRNADNSTYYGTWTYYNPVTTTGNDNSPCLTTAIIEPTEDIQVKLDLGIVGSVTAIRYTQGTYLMVEEIGSVSSSSSSSNSSGVPEGAIMAFNLASCPTGWVLADGTSGTPDLRGIFLRGSGTNSVLKYANGSYFHSTYGSYGNDSFQGWQLGTTVSGTTYYSYAHVAGYYEQDIALAGYTPIRTTSSGGQGSSAMYTAKNDNTNGVPRTGAETTPAYYSAIYCVKTAEDSATSNSIWGESGNDIIQNNASKNVVLNNNLTVNGLLKSSNGNYSLEEVKTGQTWIDGKPIYRKVIDCGAVPASGATKSVNHNISNIDISTTSYIDVVLKAHVYRASPLLNAISTITRLSHVTVSESSITMTFYEDWSGYTTNVLAIIEYTKTTD